MVSSDPVASVELPVRQKEKPGFYCLVLAPYITVGWHCRSQLPPVGPLLCLFIHSGIALVRSALPIGWGH